MAVSNKPIVWGPFAAGGTLTAFITPALILLTLLVALGHAPALLAYDRLHALALGRRGEWAEHDALLERALDDLVTTQR